MRVVVGPVHDLPQGSATVVEAGTCTVAVFNVAGQLHALDNRCAHNGGPLAQGSVRDGVVTCPWHWWRYDLATGRRRGCPQIRQRRFPVSVEDGQIVVEVPAAEAAPVSMRERLLAHARVWSREA